VSQPARQRVLLVSWDTASWDIVNPLLDQELMPCLARVIEHGVMGTLRSLRPLDVAMVHTTLATGKFADKHGILGARRMYNDGTAGRAEGSSRRAKSFWEILSQNDKTCHVIHFPGVNIAEQTKGAFVTPAFFAHTPLRFDDPYPIPPDSYLPAEYLDTFRQLTVGIEDLDAQTMGLFLQSLEGIGRDDPRIQVLTKAIAQNFTVHAVTTWLMENTEWDVLSVNYPLLRLLSKFFLKYSSPRLPWVDEREAAIFSNVLTGGVRLCDLLLHRLMQLAGPNTSLVLYSSLSQVPHTKLPPEACRGMGLPADPQLDRPEGIFVLGAPGARQDELIHSVSMTDLCPTALHLAGVPVGADMDGQPLISAFEPGYPAPQVVDSWDTQPPVRSVEAPVPADAWLTEESLYAQYDRKVAWEVNILNDWNLARTYINTNRVGEALPLLTRLYYTNPLQVNTLPTVTKALYLSGMGDEALAVMEPFAQANPDSAAGKFIGGMIAHRNGDLYRALDLFEAAAQMGAVIPDLQYYIGLVHLLTDRPDRALPAFQRALELEPTIVQAWAGQTLALMRLGRSEEAVESALSLVAQNFHYAKGHILLGEALLKYSEPDRAREAFTTALQLAPDEPRATRYLELLDESETGYVEVDPEWDDSPAEERVELTDDAREATRVMLQELADHHGRWTEDLHREMAQVDGFLAANQAALPAEKQGDEEQDVGPVPKMNDPLFENMVIRPILPADQPILAGMFRNAFARPDQVEFLLAHPVGTDDVVGAVELMLNETDPRNLELGLSLHASIRKNAAKAEWLTDRLLRAALTRASVGGAARLSFSILNESDPVLERCLHRLGFRTSLLQTKGTFSMEKLRDVCMTIVKRYERNKAIPEDIKVIPITPDMLDSVEAFFKEYFADGLGLPRQELTPHCSRVILREGKIIASYVGAVRPGDVLEVPRLAVVPEYRGGWATPLIMGHGAVQCYDDGLRSLTFCTDEEQYPGFARIAWKHLDAKNAGTVRTLTLPLVVPWPGQP
jgi:tetratricopeptide (TPR) repeat protein